MEKRHDGRDEMIVEPELPIIDAHFHLFDLAEHRYMPDDYMKDLRAGHNIIASVYVETQAFLRRSGPEVLRPLGEIEFANGVGAMASAGHYDNVRINAGIVGYADMRAGDAVAALLDRALQTAPERLKGFRQVLLDYPEAAPYRFMLAPPPKGLLQSPRFDDAFRHLAPRGLSFDATVFHTQIPELVSLADRFPDTSIVLDHLGMPMNLDATPDQRQEIFSAWSKGLSQLACRPNVTCKIGGLGMPFAGFGFEKNPEVVPSDRLAQAWKPWVEKAIGTFGPQRCMMESNYPPDGYSCGYVPLWNALKKIVRHYSQDEKNALFHGTAARVYHLDL